MSAFGIPMAGRRPRMTRAHDRQNTLPQRRCTSCTKMPSASCSGGTLYRRHFTPSHMTPIVTGPQQYSHMPQGVPSHVLEADPSHSQPHSRLSRAATTQARRHPRRAAPIAADAPPLRCVRLSTGARRCLERSMSLARAATRSRRSDHPQHPSRLEPRRPPSRRYTCADRRATRSCGRHGQHRSHK